MPHPSDVALSRLKKALSREPMLRDILADTLPGLGPIGPFQPEVDVIETSDAHVLLVDLPGVPRDKVHVRLEGARLVVEGERPRHGIAGQVRNNERGYGSFRREFLLPTDLDPEGIAAQLDDGVLTVQVPRKGGGGRIDIPIGGSED